MGRPNRTAGRSRSSASCGGAEEPSLPGATAAGVPAPAAWKILAASVTGRAHLARGGVNEDAVLTEVLADGTLVLALADGAGSAPRAAEGARLAVASAVEALALEPPTPDRLGPVLRDVLKQVRRKIASRAREVRSRPRSFACTLLLVLAHGDTLAVLQLGDGAAVGLSDGGWTRITEAHRGRHAGETLFVTSRGAVSSAAVETRELASLRAVALLSDGLEPVATIVNSGAPHGPFFDPLVDFAAGERPAAEQKDALERFLASDRVQSRCSDDLSLILAIRP